MYTKTEKMQFPEIKSVFGKWRMLATYAVHVYSGRSGLVVACLPASREVPGQNPRCGHVCLSQKFLQYAALGTGCTYTAVSRSTQPSTLRGMVNEYQPHGWVTNNTWRWVNVQPIAAYRQTHRSSTVLKLWVGRHLVLTDFHSEDPKRTVTYGFAP